jgi:hypothetical protein
MAYLLRYRTQALLIALALAGVEFAGDVIRLTGAFAIVR